MVIELIGVSAGLLYVWFMAKENILCWPIGIIYIGASYLVFFEARLYAELFSHTVFLILTIYGWYAWVNKIKEKKFPVSTLSTENIINLLSINASASLAFGFVLANYTDNALPYLDSLVAILSFTGMWLSAKKKIENWQIWMLVNTISIGIYLRQGLYFYVVLYCLFLVMAVYGFKSWQRVKSYS